MHGARPASKPLRDLDRFSAATEPVTGKHRPGMKRGRRSSPLVAPAARTSPIMANPARFYQTTAIDYPNSRPHIGTAFEKIGADVQARYRRMEGYDVHFLMGNDENTIKVARKAAELGLDPKAYCDEMARQFKEVWRALDISFDEFIQTSEPRHHAGCRKFIQKVYDNGHIYKGTYEGWYCEGCESFKTETEIKEAGGVCPDHKVPPVRRSEPCYYFALSKFRDQLLEFYERNPEFIQPESRR